MSTTEQARHEPCTAAIITGERDASSCDSDSDIDDDDEFEDDMPPSAESLLRIPPLNFASALPGVFRSGYPHRRNFEYLRTIGLKSVLYAFAARSIFPASICHTHLADSR
jgi:hypothetical protein